MHMPVKREKHGIKIVEFQCPEGHVLIVCRNAKTLCDALFLHFQQHFHRAAGAKGALQLFHRGKAMQLIHVKVIRMQELQGFLHFGLCCFSQPLRGLAREVDVLSERNQGMAELKLRIPIGRCHIEVVDALLNGPGDLTVGNGLSVLGIASSVVLGGRDNAAVRDGRNLKAASSKDIVFHTCFPFCSGSFMALFAAPIVPSISRQYNILESTLPVFP